MALQSPIALRSPPRRVPRPLHLERNHPIYRAFAERLWKVGIASITFQQGAGEKDVVAFIGTLNQAARDLCTREQTEALLRGARLERIEVKFLRQLLTHEVKEEVQSISPEEAQRQWERLMGQLAALAGPLSPGAPPAAEGGEQHPGQRPVDYAGAVIDYLKQAHQVRQQDATLQEAIRPQIS